MDQSSSALGACFLLCNYANKARAGQGWLHPVAGMCEWWSSGAQGSSGSLQVHMPDAIPRSVALVSAREPIHVAATDNSLASMTGRRWSQQPQEMGNELEDDWNLGDWTLGWTQNGFPGPLLQTACFLMCKMKGASVCLRAGTECGWFPMFTPMLKRTGLMLHFADV